MHIRARRTILPRACETLPISTPKQDRYKDIGRRVCQSHSGSARVTCLWCMDSITSVSDEARWQVVGYIRAKPLKQGLLSHHFPRTTNAGHRIPGDHLLIGRPRLHCSQHRRPTATP